jgi:hypothetical protein
MDGLRNQFLAGAALASDKDGARRSSGLTDQLEDLDHRWIAPHEPRPGAGRRGPGCEPAVTYGPIGEHATERLPQAEQIEGFHEEVYGAIAHGRRDGGQILVRRDEEHIAVGEFPPDNLQELQTAHAGHPDVAQHHIRGLMHEQGESGFRALRGRDVDFAGLQCFGQRGANPRVVVNNQHRVWHRRRHFIADAQRSAFCTAILAEFAHGLMVTIGRIRSRDNIRAVLRPSTHETQPQPESVRRYLRVASECAMAGLARLQAP